MVSGVILSISLFLHWYSLGNRRHPRRVRRLGLRRRREQLHAPGAPSRSCSWLLMLAAAAAADPELDRDQGPQADLAAGRADRDRRPDGLVLIAFNGFVDKPSANDIGDQPVLRLLHRDPGLDRDLHRRRLQGGRERRRRAAQTARHLLEFARSAYPLTVAETPDDSVISQDSSRRLEARPQPGDGAGPRDRGGSAGRRPLDRPRREGERRRRRRRRHAPDARHGPDGRGRGHRRGREGRGADALQRRGDRRRQPAGLSTSPSIRWRGPR